ncbi:response regulator transcription factor [Saccharopolyspora sp. HNM0983]|uniref:Response regulator transcription factor n=1 Tax=Saccharopolyspora montiporae TaxID=2781240 RepID=A0A929B8Z0_9PSEU|nr:response regulator transcription factor [Saccharopolyspora sp. HNM0983]MBE9375452.1 response regulator transcription factor [Saccharopolyspora sp. HNM0983]
MVHSYDRALDRAIVVLLREAGDHSQALCQVLDQVTQLVALRSQLTREAIEGPDAEAPADPRLPQLTKRERDVLEHLVRGWSNRQIARSLEISERTVKNHLHNIFTKLGVADRTSAVVKALRDQREN